jgi:GntR family transcriptional repressor for pyruvate dehydrogenase complex
MAFDTTSTEATERSGEKQRRSDVVYGELVSRIVAGEYPAGERLPTEHELARGFAVSRPVIREALMRLRADGIVAARQGSGTFVQRRPPDRIIAFAKPQDLSAMLRAFEMRLAFEGAMARLAAERREASDIAALAEHQETLRREMEAGAGMSPATDLAFHRAIAAATRNEYFLIVIDAIGGAVLGQMGLALSITREKGLERARVVFGEHERIREAIRDGDGEGAEIAMRAHIDQAKRRLTDRTRVS